jgi:predicted alpha/beta hydrolase family esterase
MPDRRFLILHGVENWRPRAHWQWWLADQLRGRGEQVLYPQLPSPSSPALDEWIAVLHGELAQMGDRERVVIAHSGSVALWLLAAPDLAPDEKVDRVLLVAPPGESAFTAPYRALLPVGLKRDAIRQASAHPPLVVASDNDPYCPEGVPGLTRTYLEPAGLQLQLMPGAGHISIDDGFGPWPRVLEWCLDPQTSFAED